ncbi:putative Core histone H2A H2B H3 H4 [Trypanosoma vivax]|nr:putative Core histone H2A H2B H3 H4 [Trypanosoma vivax]
MPKHSTLKSDVRVLHYSQNTHTLTDCPLPPPTPPLCSPLPCRARFPLSPLPSPVTAANSKQPTATATATPHSGSDKVKVRVEVKVKVRVEVSQARKSATKWQTAEGRSEAWAHQEVRDEGEQGTKRARRNPKRTWNVYVSRSLRSINSQMSMTSRTMKIVNSFVSDLFERIATEAATIVRVNRKRTLGARELQTAVRLVLPADLAKHAMAEGTKAVSHASS